MTKLLKRGLGCYYDPNLHPRGIIMASLWKIKRELKRVVNQIQAVFELARAPLVRRQLERQKDTLIQIHDGRQPLLVNVAILLIFQPKGLLASTLRTCEHLRQNGYAVLIVANSKLSEKDISTLKPACWRIMQRPNFGYDFGGYRDGVLHILNAEIRPDNLLIMNDSIWFPLFPESDLLAALVRSDLDVCGPVMQDNSRKDSKQHIQSYMINFKKRALETEAFERYWQRLPIANSRTVAIKLGEKALTPAMKKMGFSVGSVYSGRDKVKAMETVSNSELQEILVFEGQKNRRIQLAISHIVDLDTADAGWREKAEAAIAISGLKNYILISHPIVLFDKLGIPFLKKDRNVPYVLQRKALLASRFLVKVDPVMRREIETWDQAL